jgi:hypothetical protein
MLEPKKEKGLFEELLKKDDKEKKVIGIEKT